MNDDTSAAVNANYVPENDYASRNFEPFKAPSWDLCGSCEAYYTDLYNKGITSKPFPPSCEKHILERQKHLDINDYPTPEEYEATQTLLDPILWAKSEFDWEPRWYQDHMLSCTAQKKLLRCGRRLGKTEALVIETLHEMFTKKDINVLMIAPYERQVTRFFDEISKFVKKSATLKSSVHRYIKSPSRLELVNGSKILGFSSAATGSSRSDKIRGQDAHLIIIDEIDYLLDADIEAIVAILASRPDCRIIGASTPQGWRKKFYSYCTNKNLGFKEFWFISAESPSWTQELGDFFAQGAGGVNSAAYKHEYLADFAEQTEGVFKASHIEKSLENYDMNTVQYNPSSTYVLGVDWNKSAGTHMVIMEWGQEKKLRMAKKIIIPESDYTQTTSVGLIVTLNRIWNFKYVVVDAGYGATQVEMLRKEGLKDRSSGLDKKVVAIAMNQHVDIRDPITGAEVTKTAKPFLVQQTVKVLEDDMIRLPKSEDTAISENQGVLGVVQQMRNYKIESYSVLGLPRYSQGQEHTLTALMLACGGFILKDGDLGKVAYSSKVGMVPMTVNPLAAAMGPVHPSITEAEQNLKQGYTLGSTTKEGGYAPTKPAYVRDIDVGKPLTARNNIRRSETSRRNMEKGNNPRSNGMGFNRKNV